MALINCNHQWKYGPDAQVYNQIQILMRLKRAIHTIYSNPTTPIVIHSSTMYEIQPSYKLKQHNKKKKQKRSKSNSNPSTPLWHFRRIRNSRGQGCSKLKQPWCGRTFN